MAKDTVRKNKEFRKGYSEGLTGFKSKALAKKVSSVRGSKEGREEKHFSKHQFSHSSGSTPAERGFLPSKGKGGKIIRH